MPAPREMDTAAAMNSRVEPTIVRLDSTFRITPLKGSLSHPACAWKKLRSPPSSIVSS